jgi:molybdenum cofactor biosynthesis enzyme MoaA
MCAQALLKWHRAIIVAMERISIELTNQCAKHCDFCYNGSNPSGKSYWDENELLEFIEDCIRGGVKAVSFGGGEPLQYPPLYRILLALKGRIFRSITTNGLLLEKQFGQLVVAAPNKVHISIHYPHDLDEVNRVVRQVGDLEKAGIKSGINLLVRKSGLQDAERAVRLIKGSGIDNKRIVYLPMRMLDTPEPDEVAKVAGGPFQSMTCLSNCAASERFCSVAADKSVAWCSYTSERKKLVDQSYAEMLQALSSLDVAFCGGKAI